MKNKQITLIQADNDDDLYIVDSLVNRIEPQVGKVLRPTDVKPYIQMRDTKVIIKRARA